MRTEELLSMRNHRVFLALVLALLLAVALVGCGPEATEPSDPEEPVDPTEPGDDDEDPDPDEPVEGGTVFLTMWSDIENLNPVITRDSYSGLITNVVFSGLVRWTEDSDLVGDLAEEWELSEDQKSITFHLRRGVVWHDGEPFSAEDVEFFLQSLMHPDYPGVFFSEVNTIVGAQAFREGETDEVPGIEVLDEHTIRITTVDVDATLLPNLVRGVIPKHILEDVPISNWQTHDFNLNPVGTGPFSFTRYESGQYVELDAFDDYFLGRPMIDKIIWQIGDQDSMLAAFMNREVDHVSVPVAEVESLEGLDFAEIHSYASGYQWLGLNLAQERFQDRNVRQAIAYAINRRQIVSGPLRGYGFIVNSPFSPDSIVYNPNIAEYAFDPDRARQLLDEAGWTLNDDGVREKDGEIFEITLIYPTGNLVRMQSAPLVQLGLDAVGIKTEIRSLDFSTLVSRIQPGGRPVEAGDYDLFLMGLGFYLDPDISILFHSRFAWPDGWNLTAYNNPEVDRLLEKGMQYVDPEERRPYYQELSAVIAEDVPVVYLYATEDVVAINQRVRNVRPVPSTIGITHNVTEWWIPLSERR